MKWKDLHKIGITGSRKFPNCDMVTEWLHKYISVNFDSSEQVVLITGGALGVDNAVEVYCLRQGVKNLVIPARWLALGNNSAGPIRNQYIVDLSNEMLAFWGGPKIESPGTLGCIELAKKSNKPLQILTPKTIYKDLGYKPTYVTVPAKVKPRDARKLSSLVKSADLDSLFKSVPKKKKKKKKERYFL